MKNPVGTISVLVGAILVSLGLFLPYMSISGDVTDKLSAAGVDPSLLGDTSVNLFTPLCIVWLVGALVALVFAIVGNKIFTLIGALVAGGGTLFSFFVNSSSEDVDMVNGLGALVGIQGDIMVKGIGYWLALIGGIVMILAGLVYCVTCKSENKEG